MQRQLLFDVSAERRCPLSAETRHSRIGIFRHRLHDWADTLATAPAQDAHVVILQIKDQPAHDFWADDTHISIPHTRPGSLGIFDLRRESAAQFGSEVDSLHIHLPRAALVDLAIDAGAAPVTEFAEGCEWAPDDRIAQQLSNLLAPAAEDARHSDHQPQADHAPQAYIDHVILAMATHVAATYGGMQAKAIRAGTLAPWQLKRAKELLASDVADDVSLHDVAEACSLSVSYFSRAFKTATGTTPHAWLQSCRVKRARSLLVDPSLQLADIALRIGFADQSHFTRVFRRATGHTPGAWRRLTHEG